VQHPLLPHHDSQHDIQEALQDLDPVKLASLMGSSMKFQMETQVGQVTRNLKKTSLHVTQFVEQVGRHNQSPHCVSSKTV
jgi:hypothetical protein